MKLYIFLRSIIWSAVLAIIFIVASITTLIVAPTSPAPLTLGTGAITFSILSVLEVATGLRRR